MPGALARHDEIVGDAVTGHTGMVLSRMGDGIAAVFASAPDALRAALDAQLGLGAAVWGETGPLRARMGVHSDEGQLRAPGEYVNRPLNRCSRLMAVAHGGQVLVSDATAAVARDGLPTGAGLLDLGEHRLRDLAGAVRVFQLVHPDLRTEYPPLRSLDALPGNLPRQVTTFVGREAEVSMLSGFVRGRPLVTLTGVGGVGKTRLAVQVAAEAVPDFPDGAWLCELAPIADPGAVWEALAASLGLAAIPRPGPRRGGVGVPAGRSGCWWCSTTASICWMRWPASSTAIGRHCPGSRCWRPAGRASRWRASRSSRSPRSASPRGTPIA